MEMNYKMSYNIRMNLNSLRNRFRSLITWKCNDNSFYMLSTEIGVDGETKKQVSICLTEQEAIELKQWLNHNYH
jgi:hypothetical protein